MKQKPKKYLIAKEIFNNQRNKMIYLNDLRRAGSFEEALSLSSYPRGYRAASLRDFYKNRKTEIEPTSVARALAWSVRRGKSRMSFVGSAAVFLEDVIYSGIRSSSTEEEVAEFEDFSGRISVPVLNSWMHMKNLDEQNINPGDRIQITGLLYTPATDIAYLIFMDKIIRRLLPAAEDVSKYAGYTLFNPSILVSPLPVRA